MVCPTFHYTGVFCRRGNSPMRYVTCVLAVLLAHAAPGSKVLLRQNWAIQSSTEVHQSGAALSVAGFRAPGAWHPASVPTTVFGALVAAHVYPDPYFGTSLRSVPGVSYAIGSNFSNAPMPDDSPFHKPWWFRTELDRKSTRLNSSH